MTPKVMLQQKKIFRRLFTPWRALSSIWVRFAELKYHFKTGKTLQLDHYFSPCCTLEVPYSQEGLPVLLPEFDIKFKYKKGWRI